MTAASMQSGDSIQHHSNSMGVDGIVQIKAPAFPTVSLISRALHFHVTDFLSASPLKGASGHKIEQLLFFLSVLWTKCTISALHT